MNATTPHPLLARLQTPEHGVVVSAQQAVRLIRDGDTIATGGFVGIGTFGDRAMHLRHQLLAIPLEPRFSYDAQQNLFFIESGANP